MTLNPRAHHGAEARWSDLESGLWFFNALSWRTVYRRVWAGRRYALIVIKRVPK